MVSAAQQTIGDIQRNIEYKVIDVEKIMYPEGIFDIIIANNMLYHVRNKEITFAGIKRILKQDGVFYATTGSKESFKELKGLLNSFMETLGRKARSDVIVESFCLENGMEQVKKYFKDVKLIRYDNSLLITEIEAIVNYFTSLDGMKDGEDVLEKDYIDEFRKYLMERISVDKGFNVSKDSGMFICKK